MLGRRSAVVQLSTDDRLLERLQWRKTSRVCVGTCTHIRTKATSILKSQYTCTSLLVCYLIPMTTIYFYCGKHFILCCPSYGSNQFVINLNQCWIALSAALSLSIYHSPFGQQGDTQVCFTPRNCTSAQSRPFVVVRFKHILASFI